ncbi:MAG: hypothetical protein PVF83_10170 [Anaerolineales bacterium]|jgi:hypothetical protein
METKVSKQNMGWGILLICFGLVAMKDIYFQASEWIDLGIFFLGGLITLAIFLTDRSDWTLLIPAYVLLAISTIGAVAIWELVSGDLVGTVVLTLVAIPFLAVYIRNKVHWWALIPSFILLAIALMLLLTSLNILSDDQIAPFILYAIAIPFLVVYYINRENWWALIPAYTMIVIGTMVGLIEANVLDDFLVPAYIMLAIAIPFFVVYFRNKENWWALIPGGITGFIGLVFLLSEPYGRFLLPLILIAAGVWVLLRQTQKG